MNEKSVIETREELLDVHLVSPHYTAGFAIGIIAVHLVYPKLPGNVANATTYPFPVLYREVFFEIEQLFNGSDEIRKQIVDAAKYLEEQGVRAIVGACGYFAHFQEDVREAVDIPVFMSSLCQLPLIKTAVSAKKRILVVMDVYGAKTLCGIRTTVCRLKSESSFFLIATFALSVPKRKPSGRITAALPFFFSLYMMTDINKSAVSLLARSDGKLFLIPDVSLPPYGGFIRIISNLSSSV